jgi:2-polyprenyl-3-methyl-5-hydroxy-6-metoxy-1,4-benzoquinol methylase
MASTQDSVNLSAEETARRDNFVGRVFSATTGALELLHIYVGDRLGLYAALKGGPRSPRTLASTAGVSLRYAREWLEQQAVAGILDVEAEAGDPDARTYRLPAGHAEALTDADSTNFVTPFGRGLAGVAAVMPEVLRAFRDGGGVAYELYGDDLRSSISMGNRPGFLKLLGTKWFPAVPELDLRLRGEPPARIADIGCGTGWSSIGMALAYPTISVVGFDLDAASIKEARRNADESAVADRVEFELRDAATTEGAGEFDLVTAFETIHDMSDPVGALRAMRGLVKDGGFVLVVDEKVAEEFTAPGDELDRYMYGWSALHCLPVGINDDSSAATGTVMRPDQLRKYARAAGFSEVEILSVEADLWRFYRLR